MDDDGARTDRAPATFDRIAAALGHRFRRRILVGLLGDDQLDYHEVAQEVGPPNHTQVEARLVHVHLPKLDHMGYVSWDRECEVVSKGDRWEEIAPTLRLLREHREQLPDDVF